MNSTALVFVNKILSLTGDNPALTTLAGSPGSIADRIINFANLVIADLNDAPVNWEQLRVEMTGTGDGASTEYQVSTTDIVYPEDIEEVTIFQNPITEVTKAQMQRYMSQNLSGNPQFWSRKLGTLADAAVDIYPAPGTAHTITMSAYRQPVYFDVAVDSGTNDFDDRIMIYGTLAQMDGYDGLDRGYGAMYATTKSRMITKLEMRKATRTEVAD